MMSLVGPMLILSLGLTEPAPVPPAPPKLTRADLEAWLDGFLPYALQQGDVAGAVIAVVKGGEVLLVKGYGYADVARRTPVDPERTLFRPGSVAKLFTWTAVMQLVEQGKLDLDRDINGYLDFEIPPRRGQPITVRNLMTHTPGFEEVVKNLLTDEPERLLPLGPYLKTWTPNRIFPPGEVPAYSNYGVALAGYIVERLSGERYEDYIDRHILAPLGMTHSTFRQPLPDRFKSEMSRGYRLGSGPAGPYELVGPAPAGALAATGADMARFMIAHLQDGAYGTARILNPETAELMHRTELRILPPLHSALLGFFQRNLNGRRVIAHEGDSQYFHSVLSLFADDSVGVYFSVNSTGKEGAAVPIRTALIEAFTDRYFPAPEDTRSVEAKVAAEHARLMAGVYQSSRRIQSTYLSLIGLLGQVRVMATDSGTITVPAFRGLNGQPKRWHEVAPLLWREVGGKERLGAKVENGRVVKFSVDQVSPFTMFQPVPWWKSSAWLVPALSGALAVLLLTAMAWPVAAVVRRRYGVAPGLTGHEAWVYRMVRIACVAAILLLGTWAGMVANLTTDVFFFSRGLDPWVMLLRVSSLVVLTGAAILGVWNCRVVWIGKRSWLAKAWNVALALSFLVVFWVSAEFRLIGFGTNY
jgi:CubicO group peptidase (beta-lactamase class C family)